jgi:hypothetical protein
VGVKLSEFVSKGNEASNNDGVVNDEDEVFDPFADEEEEPSSSAEETDNSADLKLNQENSDIVTINANWGSQIHLGKYFGAFSFGGRICILLIQFILLVVRPLIAKRGTIFYDWTLSMVSSLFMIQFLMYSGLLAENFGGPVNNAFEGMLKTSRLRFLDKFNVSFMAKLDDDFEGDGIWKLVEGHFIASPLFENYYAVAILLGSTILSLLLCPSFESINATFKDIRIGASFSFMMPLIMSCFNCIYVFWTSEKVEPLGMVSAFLSALIIGYYIFFTIELLTPHSPYSYYFYSNYPEADFDFGTSGLSLILFPKFEYLCNLGLIVIAVVLCTQEDKGLFVVIAIYSAMILLTIATKTSEKQGIGFDYPAKLIEIQYTKVTIFFFRAVLFGGLWIYSRWRIYFTKATYVELISLGVFFLLSLDFILNGILLFFRMIGFFNSHMGDLSSNFYEEMDSDQPVDDVFDKKEVELIGKALKEKKKRPENS